MTQQIKFLAALAGTNSSARWLTISKDGDFKLSLEGPRESLGAVLMLATLGDKVLKVTVETE